MGTKSWKLTGNSILLVAIIINLLACQSLPQNISVDSNKQAGEIILTEETRESTIPEETEESTITEETGENRLKRLDYLDESEMNSKAEETGTSESGKFYNDRNENSSESFPTQLERKFSVYSEEIPEDAVNYAEQNWDNQISFQLHAYEPNQIPYDREMPVTMGQGFYMYQWNGRNLTNNGTVYFPAIQNDYILCFMAVMPLNEEGNLWTSSTNCELTAILNEQSFENGIIVYDEQGNAYYISDQVFLLEKSSTYYGSDPILTEDPEKMGAVQAAVWELILSEKVRQIKE